MQVLGGWGRTVRRAAGGGEDVRCGFVNPAILGANT